MCSTKFKSLVRKRNECGATALECGMLAALILLVTIVALPGEEIACALEESKDYIAEESFEEQSSYNCGDESEQPLNPSEMNQPSSPDDSYSDDSAPSIVWM